jgi:hypothetical protein
METVKKAETYTVYKKRNGRYGVKDAQGNWINGEEKIKILLTEKLIKAPQPKPTEEVKGDDPSDGQEESSEAQAEA